MKEKKMRKCDTAAWNGGMRRGGYSGTGAKL